MRSATYCDPIARDRSIGCWDAFFALWERKDAQVAKVGGRGLPRSSCGASGDALASRGLPLAALGAVAARRLGQFGPARSFTAGSCHIQARHGARGAGGRAGARAAARDGDPLRALPFIVRANLPKPHLCVPFSLSPDAHARLPLARWHTAAGASTSDTWTMTPKRPRARPADAPPRRTRARSSACSGCPACRAPAAAG